MIMKKINPFRLLLAGLFCISFGLSSELGSVKAAVPGQKTLSAPQQIELQYSWIGFAMRFPKESFTLNQQSDGRFKATGKHEETTRNSQTKPQNWKVNTVIAKALVTELFNQMNNSSWQATDKPLSVMEHTDDYPSFTLLFKLPDQQNAKLFSTSNTKSGAPWNLQIGKKLYVSHDPQLGEAFNHLLKQIRDSKQPVK